MQDRPTICRMVLYLASWLTFTLPRWPISAIHSRSAEMAISRPMITMEHSTRMTRTVSARSVAWPPSMPSSPGTMIVGISLLTSSTSATATMSLSATGSRNAPSREV